MASDLDLAPCLEFIDTEIAPEAKGSRYDEEIVNTVRSLLQAPDDDLDAAKRATSHIRKFYHDQSLDEDCPWTDQLGNPKDDHRIPWFLGTACNTAIYVSGFIPTDHVRHDRLLEFLAGFKEAAAEAFDPENPQLTWVPKAYGDSVAELADPKWGPDEYLITHKGNEQAYKNRAKEWINTSSLVAKLLGRDLLTSREAGFVADDIIEGLEDAKGGRSSNELGLIQIFQAVVAANHLVFGGEILAREAKSPSNSQVAEKLALGRWRAWASKLQELASTAPDDAPWGLKALAGEALHRVRELYPEVR